MISDSSPPPPPLQHCLLADSVDPTVSASPVRRVVHYLFSISGFFQLAPGLKGHPRCPRTGAPPGLDGILRYVQTLPSAPHCDHQTTPSTPPCAQTTPWVPHAVRGREQRWCEHSGGVPSACLTPCALLEAQSRETEAQGSDAGSTAVRERGGHRIWTEGRAQAGAQVSSSGGRWGSGPIAPSGSFRSPFIWQRRGMWAVWD